MFSSMALLWKSCFQVWPFHGNHVFKYGHSMDTMFFKYGPLMEIMFFEVWHFDETCSSVTILTKYNSY